MNNLDPQSIAETVPSFTWYHTLDLGQGILTPGVYDHRPYLPAYGFPKNLTGYSGLDIGAASGFFTFELEKRGAQMTSTELSTWLAHDFGPKYEYAPNFTAPQAEHYLHEPYLFAHKVLNSKAQRKIISIYDISPATVGSFDIVFCGSVLLHLTDPARALQHIQSVTREVAIIATALHPLDLPDPLALFAGEPKGTIWWHPNRAGFEAMIKSAGFTGWEWFSEFRLDYRNGQPGPYHGVIRAWNSPERPKILDNTDQPPPDLIHMRFNPCPGSTSEADTKNLAALQLENQRLSELITVYENMKYTQFVRWLHPYRQKLNTLLGIKK